MTNGERYKEPLALDGRNEITPGDLAIRIVCLVSASELWPQRREGVENL